MKILWHHSIVRVYPLIFVLLWSTGFIAAKYALPFVEPLLLITIRLGIAISILPFIIFFKQSKWPERKTNYIHLALSGLLIHGCFQGGIFYSIHNGLPAGLCALIIGLQPIATALLLFTFTDTKLSGRQWLGVAIGFLGVFFVLDGRLGSINAYSLGLKQVLPAFIGLAGLVLGTMYQKKYCQYENIFCGSFVQYITCIVFVGLGAFIFEDHTIAWSYPLFFSILWLSCVLSIGAISILFVLIRTKTLPIVSAYFYLVPVFTVSLGYLLFEELVSLWSSVGMITAIVGVCLVTNSLTVFNKISFLKKLNINAKQSKEIC